MPSNYPSEDPDLFEIAESVGMKSSISIPLISEGSPIAILGFRSVNENAFDSLNDEFLIRIAEQMAGAIAYDQVNARLQVEADQQTAFARIGRVIGSELEIDLVFDEVATVLKDLIDFDVVMVTSPSADGSLMKNLPVAGPSAKSYKKSDWYAAAGSLAEKNVSKPKTFSREDHTNWHL